MSSSKIQRPIRTTLRQDTIVGVHFASDAGKMSSKSLVEFVAPGDGNAKTLETELAQGTHRQSTRTEVGEVTLAFENLKRCAHKHMEQLRAKPDSTCVETIVSLNDLNESPREPRRCVLHQCACMRVCVRACVRA